MCRRLLAIFVVLCGILCFSCTSFIDQDIMCTSAGEAHLYDAISKGKTINGIFASKTGFIVNIQDEGFFFYNYSEVPFGEITESRELKVNNMSTSQTIDKEDVLSSVDLDDVGSLYVNGNQLLAPTRDSVNILFVLVDHSYIYFFSPDGTVLSLTKSNAVRPPVLSVYSERTFLSRNTLRVLDIGNSYSDDALCFLSPIVASQHVDDTNVCVYKLTRGSASYKNWVDVYCGRDDCEYSLAKVVGKLEIPLENCTCSPRDPSLMLQLMRDVRWDLIVIHQVSNYAPYYHMWKECSEAGMVDEFLSILRECQPKAAIGFLLVHSYMDTFSGNTEHSSYLRWRRIASSTKRFCSEYGIGLVIPYGTAVENLRQSEYNNEFCLTRDGVHLGYGLPHYTASCCYYQSIFYPRTMGSVVGDSFRFECPDYINSFIYPESCIDVTDENAIVAQESAVRAVTNKYSVIGR